MMCSLDDYRVYLTNTRKDEPLPQDATVRVDTTDFLLAGGNGLFKAEDPSRATDAGLVRDCVSRDLATGVSEA